MRDQVEATECFLPTIDVVSQGSYIRFSDARRELRMNSGEYVRDRLPSAHYEVVAEDLDAV